MELKKLTGRVFYYPHQPQTGRPLLAYLKGEKIALAVDAGSSSNHVEEFYRILEDAGLKLPDFTVLTHWHWSHAFGLHRVEGFSVALKKTNEYLNQERAKLTDPEYEESLKQENEYFALEYGKEQDIIVVPAEFQFEGRLTIRLGGMTAEIFHVESPHTEDTVLIRVPEESVLFLGDCIHEISPSKDKIQSLIHAVEESGCQHMVLSHEEPMPRQELLRQLISMEQAETAEPADDDGKNSAGQG